MVFLWFSYLCWGVIINQHVSPGTARAPRWRCCCWVWPRPAWPSLGSGCSKPGRCFQWFRLKNLYIYIYECSTFQYIYNSIYLQYIYIYNSIYIQYIYIIYIIYIYIQPVTDVCRTMFSRPRWRALRGRTATAPALRVRDAVRRPGRRARRSSRCAGQGGNCRADFFPMKRKLVGGLEPATNRDLIGI